MFDIAPYLHPNDPWVAADGVPFVRSIYEDKYCLAKLLKPTSIVEIGVRAGYTAAAFLAACPTASYHGYDYDGPEDPSGGWQGSSTWAESSLRRHFPGSDITITRLDTQSVASLPAGSVDLFHVDGDHSYRGALHDLDLAKQLRPRWIVIDDITHVPDVGRAVRDFLSENSDYTYVILRTVRGDAVLQQKGKQ